MRLEPETDLREPLKAFNAAHADHPLGTFLEGVVRLAKDEREGLALLERACVLDPEAIKPACERAIAFLAAHHEKEAADAYAARWRERDALESARAHQLENLQARDALTSHRLGAAALEAIRSRLRSTGALSSVREAYLVRRPIAADSTVVQHVLGVRLGGWSRQRGRQGEVLKCLAALDWPVPLVFLSLDGKFRPMRSRMRALSANLLR